MRAKNVKLSRREREIMDLLYATEDPLAADTVREQLTDSPSNSAVRAMLTKLETKGQIGRRADGLRYVYAPTGSRTAARRNALTRLIEVFFGGSPERTATALLEHDDWTEEELDALSAQIEAIRAQRTKKATKRKNR